MAKDPKAIEGQIIRKDEQLPTETDKGGGFGLTNVFGFMLRGRAMAKAAEIEARFEEASADAAEARERRLTAEEAALAAGGRLSEDNRNKIVEAVSKDVTAELNNSRGREEKADRDRQRQHKMSDNDDLEEDVRELLLQKQLKESQVDIKKLDSKLKGNEKSLAEEITKAEDERDAVMAEIVEAKKSAGGKPDMDAARVLSRKLQSVLGRLEKLYDRRSRQEDEADD